MEAVAQIILKCERIKRQKHTGNLEDVGSFDSTGIIIYDAEQWSPEELDVFKENLL